MTHKKKKKKHHGKLNVIKHYVKNSMRDTKKMFKSLVS